MLIPLRPIGAAAIVLAQIPVATAHERLAIGDGRIANAPKAGYVFSCQQRFDPNAPGAQRSGNWISGGAWIPALKPFVDGAVVWPDAQIDVAVSGDKRIVRANNLPKHKTGVFPVAANDDAARYDRNPGRIRAQSILLELPALPQLASVPSCVPMGMIGFALTGVAIYNALDARGQDAAAHEILDSCDGHPQQQGQYHYHAPSRCWTDAGKEANGHSDLIGYALDGFGIYGTSGGNGATVHNEDLDACHGHTHAVTWDGGPVDLYHYHFTDEYPYSVGCFRGIVKTGQVAAPAREPQDGRQMLRNAAAKLGIGERQLADAVGAPPPDFAAAARRLGIAEAKIRAAFGQ
jgi:hypothetical protein